MKITYRREMKHNYLIVDPESLTWRNYECRMLAANFIEGVLHFQMRQVDDEIRFYYEITSRQPLDRMLEGRSVHTEELRSLVFGISRVLDRMEQYLLPEGSVLLTPDHIYVEPETFRIWLCLVPGLERDFPEDYGKLLEYLLGKVDHQDKDSVVLAYGLYQETRKENYGMEDILRLFGGGQMEETATKEKNTEEQGLLCSEEKGEIKEYAEEKRSRRKRQDASAKRTSREKQDLWSRMKGWWKRKRGEAETETVQVPWEMMFREEDMVDGAIDTGSGLNQTASDSPLPGQSKQIRQHKEHASEIQPGQDTVLLADLTPDTRTKLHCLHALDQDGADIVISYYPFIIGKQENLVDFLLPYDTVSRLHLRIDRNENKYFVQDLNSTNGTTVEGRLLENNESVEIQEGDEIHIARYRYRFD
ncbi:DUF6382 domain-containing protein [Clostridium sp. AN503]|uniref:DUF6382 domain-containing protein n=1 Tax=Clostridium sp. AN503 TaxID=3160598 RepID=UPI00345B1D73